MGDTDDGERLAVSFVEALPQDPTSVFLAKEGWLDKRAFNEDDLGVWNSSDLALGVVLIGDTVT